MKASDIITLLSIVIAVVSVVSEPQLEALWPAHGAYLSGVLTIVGLAAGQIIRVLNNKNGAPPPAIAEGTPIVPAGTTVVTSATPQVAINTTHAPNP